MEPQSSQLARETPVRLARPLRLLLDGRKLGDGGIGVYTENLMYGLLASNQVQLSVITHPDRVKRGSFGNDVEWLLDTATPYSFDEMVHMPRRVDFSRFDIFHTPHYMLPFGIPIPKVVTVHDLIHISHPERFYYPVVARTLISSAVRRADKVIAVSNHTREQLITKMGLSTEKVLWIPNATQTDEAHIPPTRNGLQRKISDLKPYVLGVFSNIKPHKALPDLLTAFQKVRSNLIAQQVDASNGNDSNGTWRSLKLVLVGHGTEELLQSSDMLHLVSATHSVHVVGSVSRQELSQLYSSARCVAIPSLAEGFCLPVIETQAAGTRVVTRPVPAIQELLSPHDLVAADFSVDAFSSALQDAVSSPALTIAQKAETKERLNRYSREQTGRQTLTLYSSIVKGA